MSAQEVTIPIASILNPEPSVATTLVPQPQAPLIPITASLSPNTAPDTVQISTEMSAPSSQSKTMDESSTTTPQNPLKRKASDLTDNLVAKAVRSSMAASAMTSGTMPTKDTSLSDMLVGELTCGICSEILFDPVTVIDCLHGFCGSCVAPWFKDNATCPTCRLRAKSVRDSFQQKPMLEILLKDNPKLARSEEEIEELRKVYKPGQKIKPCRNNYDSEDELSLSSDDEDDNSLYGPFLWRPCPCCTPGAFPQYTCPDPIVLENDEPIRNSTSIYKNHKPCSWCDTSVPVGADPILNQTQCCMCDRVCCGHIFGQCAGSGNLIKIAENSLYQDLPQTFWANVGLNNVEYGRLDTWLGEHGMTRANLGEKMRDWLFPNNDPVDVTGRVGITKNHYMCSNCSQAVYSFKLVDYLIAERNNIGYTDDRVKCWYGRNCRTQRHNDDHSQRLQHVCEETPEEARIDRSRTYARPPQAANTGSVRARPSPASAQSQVVNVPDVPPPSTNNTSDESQQAEQAETESQTNRHGTESTTDQSTNLMASDGRVSVDAADVSNIQSSTAADSAADNPH